MRIWRAFRLFLGIPRRVRDVRVLRDLYNRFYDQHDKCPLWRDVTRVTGVVFRQAWLLLKTGNRWGRTDL